MAGKREKPEDIVLKLRQVEVLQGQGKSVQEAVRQIGVTVQTYYRWRKKYGGKEGAYHCAGQSDLGELEGNGAGVAHHPRP